jgi:putative phosphoesterase
MKTALVMADTHGHKARIALALKRFADVDMIFHLGDYSRDAELLRTMTKKPVYSVRGNCDISAAAEAERLLTFEGVRVLMVHGHRQNVKSSLLNLGLYAQEQEANIALFGHTHMPTEQYYENVLLYNPGSLGEPRDLRPSVGLLTLDQGTFRTTTVRL